jgi:hypothetical protein
MDPINASQTSSGSSASSAPELPAPQGQAAQLPDDQLLARVEASRQWLSDRFSPASMEMGPGRLQAFQKICGSPPLNTTSDGKGNTLVGGGLVVAPSGQATTTDGTPLIQFNYATIGDYNLAYLDPSSGNYYLDEANSWFGPVTPPENLEVSGSFNSHQLDVVKQGIAQIPPQAPPGFSPTT